MPRPRSWSKKSVDGLFYTNTPIQTLQSAVVLRKKKQNEIQNFANAALAATYGTAQKSGWRL